MGDIEAALERKSILQRSIHSYFEHRSRIISVIVTSVGIILPAMLTFIVFSDISFLKQYIPSINPNNLKLVIGLSSFLLFLLAVFDQIFQITTRHNEHRRAIELYTQLLRDMTIAELGNVSGDESNFKLELFNQRYLQVSSNTIHFTEDKFARAEKAHLKYRAIRKARKELVFAWPWQVNKRAKVIAETLYNEEKIKKAEHNAIK